jgi:hypothetical protein
MNKLMVRLSNFLTRLRRTRVKPEALLLIFPRCIQRSGCANDIVVDVRRCERCGRCKVTELLALSEKYGCRVESAAGGRLAVAKVKEPAVKAIVAVACGKELRQGILASFPKAAIGIVNTWPAGPCRDTDVDLDSVERAIQWLVRE